ncbi:MULTISPECIES: hypothetical protein [Sphingomonas]|jgi:hypothetical protein|uniref:Uncharacterized protein n=1 Tax=Sphingomonas ginsenosidimutans TaxID=862134 RepID=A0A2A4I3F5_9SPHN|nr:MULTISPECIES: hypothetical protein [Sphingomonas]MBY0300854.1 hypothetical protein [Sphingomonas ginsenosidimutans]MEE2740291.1 hypothetical protein [Pseudomonadota bacterium]PCG10455.1 hypothetical protein COA17_03250 [Sphingomonas ginsenosidimutans]
MTRRLVLTNEAARHPFRRSLPPMPVSMDEAAAIARAKRGEDDWKLFFLSFAAFFICFYTMIA